jgi:hypothetical protein
MYLYLNKYVMDSKINKIIGYYTVGNLEFSSKIDACVYATKTKQNVRWHFNNEIFDNYPWHIEPAENLDDLYDQRAREIRDKYDYLVLAFSGGGDSNNILESFLRQNLLIDEVVVNVMGDRNSFTVNDPAIKNNWNEAAEYRLQTVPRLNYIKAVSPKTKISVIDLSTHVFDFFNQHGDENWLKFTRERLNVSGLMRHNFLHFKEIRNRFDKDKKIAMILGIEKPRTYIKNNVFKLMFSDKAVNIATVQEFIEDYSNTSLEYFYWHPDSTKIIAKQAHIIKRWLEQTPNFLESWTPKSLDDLYKKHRTVHEPVLRSLLYSTWKSHYWQSEKSTLDWYSEIDDWFAKGHSGSRAHQIWQAGLNYIKNNASDYMIPGNHNLGLKGFSFAYEIGTMKNFNLDQPNQSLLHIPGIY